MQVMSDHKISDDHSTLLDFAQKGAVAAHAIVEEALKCSFADVKTNDKKSA